MANYFFDPSAYAVDDDITACGWTQVASQLNDKFTIQLNAESQKVLRYERVTGTVSGDRGWSFDAATADAARENIEMLMLFERQNTTQATSYLFARRSEDATAALLAGAVLATNPSVRHRTVISGTATTVGSTTIGSGNKVDLVSALRVRINGTTVQSRLWWPANPADPTADEPETWGRSETITGVSGAGRVGIYSYDSGAYDILRVAFATGGDTATFAAGGDTTSPTLTSPTASATGATTASGSVTTNEANGTLYYLATANASESVATVKAGSSQAVSASGVQNVTVTGLTASTSYYLHFVHTDAAANDSTVATSAQFTTDAPSGDTDPPTLTGTVTFTSITQTSYTAQWPAGSDNVAVTGYEYQIGSTAGAWTDAGNNLSAAITGRTAGTTETVYVRAYDAAGLRSTPAISGEVTLESIPAAGINVTEPLKNNTGTVLASQSGVRVAVLQAADLVSVFETSGLTTNASGILATISDAAIITGQQYHVAIKLADGGVGITGPITAS